jgi:hypothetical protein
MAEETGAPEIDQLIVAAATGTVVLSPSELRRVLEHIAQAGFDPNAREQVRGRLAGVVWQGQVLRGRDRLPPDEVHYLWHVVTRQEWPAGTTLSGYSETVRQVILDPASGVFTSRYQGALQVGIVRSSDDLRGPRDFGWLLVEYRVMTGHWTTAYQLPSIMVELQNERRGDVRWLRPQQRIVV